MSFLFQAGQQSRCKDKKKAHGGEGGYVLWGSDRVGKLSYLFRADGLDSICILHAKELNTWGTLFG